MKLSLPRSLRDPTLIPMVLCLIVVGALVPQAVTMPGCALVQRGASPDSVYFDTQEAFILSVRNLNAARRAGEIGDEDWVNIYLPAINRGNSILDDMDAARAAGDFDRLNALRLILDSINTTIDQGGDL